ncbi:hypothetical protein SAMN05421636_105276 [Pricia antarctica]|uniref:Uncharacterized protein n=1 Tax=Pricia antarctica TaxID=641691 RepID=A0A1G7DDC8_9FLAO|nr:hypothetical protein [Pricia antarctica]SDE49567.1 hypothetical protein SAMN05421636_105276 [Pricia antarctica]
MKNILFFLWIGTFATTLQAQVSPVMDEKNWEIPVVGAVFEIGEASAHYYKHIQFPRANFIIKRGGFANYQAMENIQVVVASLKVRKEGTAKVYLKRADGKRFFGSHLYVAANVKQALASGELR